MYIFGWERDNKHSRIKIRIHEYKSKSFENLKYQCAENIGCVPFTAMELPSKALPDADKTSSGQLQWWHSQTVQLPLSQLSIPLF